MLASFVTRRNRMYTWLNKRSVLVLNISNKERKKLTTLVVQIDRKRSPVKAPQFCWCVAPCKNDLVSLYTFMTQMIHEVKQPHQNPF